MTGMIMITVTRTIKKKKNKRKKKMKKKNFLIDNLLPTDSDCIRSVAEKPVTVRASLAVPYQLPQGDDQRPALRRRVAIISYKFCR
jgi:hypothetical protein